MKAVFILLPPKIGMKTKKKMLPPARMDFQISDDENQNFFYFLALVL